ncbi:MAG TPA: hypothetical protein VN228_15110 [Pyrinomonadaceae bacterium]|nr:hypothetical protein [Pyrinomonadaceae bacterium]
MLSALAAGCALSYAPSAFAQEAGADFPIPYEATQNPVYYFTRETFEPYVGGVFRGWVGRTAVDLVLLSVTGYAPAAATKITTTRPRRTETFTLAFHAGRSLSTLTDMHTLDHAALGRFALNMKRTVDDRGRIIYEAVISHLA